MPTRWLSYAHHLAGYEFYMRDELEVAQQALADSLEQGGIYGIRLLRLVEAELDLRRSAERVRTEHFDCELPPHRPPGVAALLRSAPETCYDALARELDFTPGRALMVSVLRSPGVLEFTSSPFGYYVPKRDLHKICLPLGGARPLDDLRKGLVHEYTHAAVAELSGDNYPAWLTEGLAVHFAHKLARGRNLVDRAKSTGLEFMSLGGIEGFFSEPERDLFSDEATQAYAESYSAVRFLLDRSGAEGVRRLLSQLGRRRPLGFAMWRALGLWPRSFEHQWREAAESRRDLLAWVP